MGICCKINVQNIWNLEPCLVNRDRSYMKQPYHIAYSNMLMFDKYIDYVLANTLHIFNDLSAPIYMNSTLFLIHKIGDEYVFNVTDACVKDSYLMQLLEYDEALKDYIKNKIIDCGFSDNNKKIKFTRFHHIVMDNMLNAVLYLKML